MRQKSRGLLYKTARDLGIAPYEKALIVWLMGELACKAVRPWSARVASRVLDLRTPMDMLRGETGRGVRGHSCCIGGWMFHRAVGIRSARVRLGDEVMERAAGYVYGAGDKRTSLPGRTSDHPLSRLFLLTLDTALRVDPASVLPDHAWEACDRFLVHGDPAWGSVPGIAVDCS
jgi:hypothetical protein